MNARALIRLAAELEYGVPLPGDVIPLTPSNTSDVPLLTVARHRRGYVTLYGEQLDPSTTASFRRQDASVLFEALASADAFCDIGATRVVDCLWYVITRVRDASEFPDVTFRDGRFVIERDARIAAQAWSAQEGTRAAEVEVETDPGYRRLGYGRQAVAAWAHHVRRDGKVALYSHLLTNDASRALIKSLGAWNYAEIRELF